MQNTVTVAMGIQMAMGAPITTASTSDMRHIYCPSISIFVCAAGIHGPRGLLRAEL